LRHHLDRAVRLVAGVAGDAELLGAPQDEIAIAHPLHAALDDVTRCGHRSSSLPRRRDYHERPGGPGSGLGGVKHRKRTSVILTITDDRTRSLAPERGSQLIQDLRVTGSSRLSNSLGMTVASATVQPRGDHVEAIERGRTSRTPLHDRPGLGKRHTD